MKTLNTLLLGAAAIAFVTPAFADFYIIQEPTTKRCRIVEERPAPNIGVIVGAPFGLRVEAENRMRVVEVCRDGTTGGPPAVIEERERVIRER